MILPDHIRDALARHPDAPAALGIGVALALVLAVVLLSGRRKRRVEPVVGHYTCHACRGALAVALVRLPHERLARLACTLPECRAAYGVVVDDGDPVGTLHRAHAAYLRVMTRPVPPRNAGRRKAVPSPALARGPDGAPGMIVVTEFSGAHAVASGETRVSPMPAESPDWSGFGPVPLPGPVKLVETDAPGRNNP